jgi:hypothetical protein
MNEDEARRYIGELYKIVSSSSILVIDYRGAMHRVYCPFRVLAVIEVPPDIIQGKFYFVEAVKMDLLLKEVYIIKEQGYYYWGFLIHIH